MHSHIHSSNLHFVMATSSRIPPGLCYMSWLFKLTLKQKCDDFVFWWNSNLGQNKNGHHFAHVIFNVISSREIAVFSLYKFALRLKQNGHHIADDNFQLIILVWVLLYFDTKSHSEGKSKMAAVCKWLSALGVKFFECPLFVIVEYNGAVAWSLLISTMQLSLKSHVSA